MTGMGGLGKTTLARQAFHHDKVKKKFDRLVWVCVSQDFNRKNVWQTILQNFRPKEEENRPKEEENRPKEEENRPKEEEKRISQMTEARLQDELSGLLETSKSLIVFDDIWEEEHWSQIKDIFPSEKGWKVLITSRNESIAGHGEPYINFKPECLSDQDSWKLFQRIAMPSKDSSELKNVAKEMEEMGKQMIKHCGGLPLAIRVLGGLLAEKYTFHNWKRVSENIGFRLMGGRTNPSDGNKSLVDSVLSLSYEELPGYLKHCFLYLAHFPEDYEMNLEDLSYYWAAEGILSYNDGETIRDAGDSCIEELVRRNMVISERDSTTSRFEICHLHDMMRDFCLSKAKEENFLQIIGIHSPTAHSQSHRTHRRFVSHDPTRLDVEREINNSKARSLVVFGKTSALWKLSHLIFTRLPLLRVIHLAGFEIKGDKLHSGIGKLVHLRYLNLQYTYARCLPSSLRNLKLLVYLNLNFFGDSIFLPNVLMEMKELRYLALPCNLHTKTKLELSHLVNLETLMNFSTENSSLEDLRGMARLRTLQITLTRESSLETLSASIGGLRHLENLDITYLGNKGTEEWGSLLDFNNLKELKLRLYTQLLCEDLQFPSSLTSLDLMYCQLEEDLMPILEKLGHLKKVILRLNSFCGRRMVCSGGGFPQLQTLDFWQLDEWEEWIVEEGSMPLLHTLEIDCCKKLKELPDGIRFITSLKNLTLSNMGEEWKKRLSEGGEDYHKVQHIPSINFNNIY